MPVSLWWALNVGCVRNFEVLTRAAGMESPPATVSRTSAASSPVPTMDAPTSAAITCRSCSCVVVSSHETWTTPSPASYRLYPAALARSRAARASVGPGSSTPMVSKASAPLITSP